MDAYLIVLSGQGDIHGRLVNEDTWAWLADGSNPVTDQMVADYIATYLPHCNGPRDPEIQPDHVRKKFESSDLRSVNDRALQLCGSMFNGKQYDMLDHTHRKLKTFLKKHKLTLKDEWYGYIY